MSLRHHHRRRSGMTLVELLVVIFIILLITAIAIPVLAPALSQRRGRETSRIITSFIQGARTRAIETGRPHGVAFGVSGGPADGVNVLHYVEVPMPYAGDNVGSTITVFPKALATDAFAKINFTGTESGWIGLLRPNDLIKFNYQGRMYRLGVVNAAHIDAATGFFLASAANATDGLTVTAVDGTQLVPPPGAYPFQIHRLPVFTSATPLLLPAGVVIDMLVSGYDSTDTFVLNEMGVLLFSPNGSVSSVINGAGSPFSPTSPIHLMVGKVEQVASAAATPELPLNFADLENFWVSIHPQTGLVSSTEVSDFNGDGTITLAESRFFAQQAQSMGGR